MKITSARDITALLSENGLSPLKKFGQNFLIDDNIVKKIASAAVPEDAFVLEIGTGLGALTLELAGIAKKVVSVEIDRGLIATHAQTFASINNIMVIEGDILKTDISALCQEHFDGRPFYACGNLPYYITSKILMHLLESGAPIERLTAMMQREVADRLASNPGDTEYGALTASCRYYAQTKLLFTVSRNCFYPAPDVDSAIISFDLTAGKMDVPREAYARLVRRAFSMRRKTLVNNLKQDFPVQNVVAAMEQLGIAPSVRAQEISPELFARLAELLERK